MTPNPRHSPLGSGYIIELSVACYFADGGGRRFLGEVKTVRHAIGRGIARIQCLQTENSLAEFNETDMRVQRLRNVPSHNCPT
jgi:hypothetical protein